MAFIAGAIAGGAFGLLRTLAQDLLESDEPDQAKIAEVKKAIKEREAELQSEGLGALEASVQASDEFKQALDEASQDVDGTTAGDYIANITTDALMGGGLGWFGSSAKGAAAMGKVKSFIPGTKANAARKALATEDELAQLGTQAAKRQELGEAEAARRMAKNTASELNPRPPVPGEGASSLNPAFAPGRMPAIGQTKPVSMNAPGPTAMPMVDDAIPGASTELMSGIPGARSSLRAVPVGPPTGGAHPMEGASSKLGKLVQGDVWPEEQVIAGRLGMRSPKTIDTTAELVSPGIGMADDALLNAEIDQIVQAAMGKAAPRIGWRNNGRVIMPTIDPTQGAMNIPSFLR